MSLAATFGQASGEALELRAKALSVDTETTRGGSDDDDVELDLEVEDALNDDDRENITKFPDPPESFKIPSHLHAVRAVSLAAKSQKTPVKKAPQLRAKAVAGVVHMTDMSSLASDLGAAVGRSQGVDKCEYVIAPECVTSFTYKYNDYSGCTTVGHASGTPWCSHHEKYKSRQWSECVKVCEGEEKEKTIAESAEELVPTVPTIQPKVDAPHRTEVPHVAGSLKEYCTPAGERLVEGTFFVNERVSANYNDYGQWSKGVITDQNGDGTFNVKYDSGLVEFKVPADRLRKRATQAPLVDASKEDPVCKVEGFLAELTMELDAAREDVAAYLAQDTDAIAASATTTSTLAPDGSDLGDEEELWKQAAVNLLEHNEYDLDKVMRSVDTDADGLVSEIELMAELERNGVPPARAEELTAAFFKEVFGEAAWTGGMSGDQLKTLLSEACNELPQDTCAVVGGLTPRIAGAAPGPGPAPAPALNVTAIREAAEQRRLAQLQRELDEWELSLTERERNSPVLREQLKMLRNRWQEEDKSFASSDLTATLKTPEGKKLETTRLKELLSGRMRELEDLLWDFRVAEQSSGSPLDHCAITDNLKEKTGKIQGLLDKLSERATQLKKEGVMDPELEREISHVMRMAGVMTVSMKKVVAADEAVDAAEDALTKAADTNVTAAAAGKQTNDAFNKDLEDLVIVFREMREQANDFDKKVVPNKTKWWRYRWEYSFVEASILVLLCLLAIFWETVHWKIRGWIVVHASSQPSFNKNYWDTSLTEEMSRFACGEIWVLVMVYASLWVIDRCGLWSLWLRLSWSVGLGMNLPMESRTYSQLAFDITMQLALGMMMFFVLMTMICVIANHCEVHFHQLDDGEEDSYEHSPGRSQALSRTGKAFAENKAEFAKLRSYFEKCMRSAIPEVTEALVLEYKELRERGSRFMLWYFIALKVKSEVFSSFMIRVATWGTLLAVWFTFALLHWFFHVEFAALTLLMLCISAIPMAYMIHIAREECAMLKEEVKYFANARLFTNEPPTSPRQNLFSAEAQRHRGEWHSKFPWVAIFQVTIFFLCYSAARLLFSPWMFFFYPFMTMTILIIFLVFLVVFRLVIAPVVVKYFIALSFPPHITNRDAMIMKRTGEEGDNLFEVRHRKTLLAGASEALYPIDETTPGLRGPPVVAEAVDTRPASNLS